MKPSLPTLCATAISVLMNVGMRNVGGFLGTVVVDAFEFQPFRKFQVRSPTGSHRCGPIPLWVQLEKSETQSPISNKDDESVKNNTTKKKREFRTGMVRNLPSSRSTATFALYENLRRQTTIAVRILENDPNYKALEGRDRSFARLLLTTAERRQGQIDHIIQQLIHQTNKPTKRKVREENESNNNGDKILILLPLDAALPSPTGSPKTSRVSQRFFIPPLPKLIEIR